MVSSMLGQFGDQVVLLSPMETFEEGTLLTFYYHMMLSDEDTTAALTVFTYSQLHAYERLLIEIRGNHGPQWQHAEVCLPGGTYQLAFVATHGLQFSSDIALDEIELDDDEWCRSPEYLFFAYENAEHEGKYLTRICKLNKYL